MQFLILSVFLLLDMTVQAASKWKIIAESVSCPEKIQILGKEGESYVLVVYKNQQKKLYSKDQSKFRSVELTSTEYSSDVKKDNYILGDPTFTFYMPGEVEGNPPKLDMAYSGRIERCRMNSR